MNAMKTALLMAALTLILVLIGQAIGGRGGAIFFFFLALMMNLITYWFSDKIILKMYRAQEAPANSPVREIVRDLTMRSGLPMPKVYIIPSDNPNAFATGRNPRHSAVAVTEGINRILNREELSGVIGHELSHVRNRDILIGTIAASIAGAISMIAFMGRWAAMFGGFGGRDERGGNPIALVGLMLMLILAPIAAMIIQLAISRSREYAADQGGAKICGNPLYLAQALRKLEMAARRIPMENVKPATAHMFIVNPLRGRDFASLFSTHPPIEERIRRLEAMVGLA